MSLRLLLCATRLGRGLGEIWPCVKGATQGQFRSLILRLRRRPFPRLDLDPPSLLSIDRRTAHHPPRPIPGLQNYLHFHPPLLCCWIYCPEM